MVNLNVNGTARSFDGDDDMPLLWYLRDELRLTGTRFGCGAGLCGACTVHVDGKAVRACQTQMRTVQNKRIVTIEGLSADGSHPLQRAWTAVNVPQCGYCQTGQIMQAAALSANAEPNRSDIDRTWRQHLPVRHVPAHPFRHQAGRRHEGRPGMSLIDNISNVSRRQFLEGLLSTGAFVVAAQVLPESAWAQDPGVRTRAQSAPLSPSVYLGIEPDGTVFIVTHRSEMGTGIRTSLPLIAADELDCDWSRVRIEQGLGDTKYGDQNTDGSRSVRDFYDAFRRAGASARVMLTSAAATQWGVPVTECAARTTRSCTVPAAGVWRSARWCPRPRSCPSRLRNPCGSSRRTSGSSSGRNGPFTTWRISPRARPRSASTSTARTWWWPPSSTRLSWAAR
jgi:aerobic-type carbon monoxide dehydrogenase small subunit (CoxS/CutS family)